MTSTYALRFVWVNAVRVLAHSTIAITSNFATRRFYVLQYDAGSRGSWVEKPTPRLLPTWN